MYPEALAPIQDCDFSVSFCISKQTIMVTLTMNDNTCLEHLPRISRDAHDILLFPTSYTILSPHRLCEPRQSHLGTHTKPGFTGISLIIAWCHFRHHHHRPWEGKFGARKAADSTPEKGSISIV